MTAYYKEFVWSWPPDTSSDYYTEEDEESNAKDEAPNQDKDGNKEENQRGG